VLLNLLAGRCGRGTSTREKDGAEMTVKVGIGEEAAERLGGWRNREES